MRFLYELVFWTDVIVKKQFCHAADLFLGGNHYLLSTRYCLSKNHVYKNVEPQICPNFKNIVVNLLVAISISFPVSDKI